MASSRNISTSTARAQRLVLCAYKDELPRDADEWFWGSPLFDELGRFTGLDAEMERIALASLAEYPLLQIKTAAIATAVNSIWHTYGIVERYRSGLVPDMRAARQQRGPRTLSFGACLPAAAANRRLHAQAERARSASSPRPVSLRCWRMPSFAARYANPHDRYGARLIWLAVTAAAIAAVRLYEERERLRATGLSAVDFASA